MANVGVIGAGSWGTALSVLLADNGHHVTIWSIDEKEVEMLDKKREHLTKLPGVKLSDGMTITGDLESAVKGKDFLVLAVPSPFTRATAKKMSAYVGKGQIIVDVAKGIEESTLLTLSAQIEEETYNFLFHPHFRLSLLLGCMVMSTHILDLYFCIFYRPERHPRY